MRAIRLGCSKEEKVAVAIGRLVSDFSLDLEAVGKHLALTQPFVVYSRVMEILEATQYNREVAEYREIGKYYADKLF